VEDQAEKDEGHLLDAEFHIDKQRDGRKGKVTCLIDPDFLRFTYTQQPLR
jgi:replicative DNA helicase